VHSLILPIEASQKGLEKRDLDILEKSAKLVANPQKRLQEILESKQLNALNHEIKSAIEAQ
jgi:hypothetical protein